MENEKRKTILVVDDEAANRHLMETILAAEGGEIVTAADGKQALALVTENPPDLILLDIMMPDMSGFDVLRAMKADAATAGIPVIMVTALDNPDAMAQAIEGGADEVLTKPVNAAELLLRVKNMLYSDGVRS